MSYDLLILRGGGSTEPGDPYLSRLPDIYSNVSLRPVACPHFLGRYSNACNAIDNHSILLKSDLALDKYRVTKSGCFILVTTVALGMGIIDRNLLFCQRGMQYKTSTLCYPIFI